ncbi:MAG: ammonium transporter, partial [Candidatus Binataceae bacterium]
MLRRPVFRGAVVLIVTASATAAYAQNQFVSIQQNQQALVQALNLAWVLIAGFLVMFMQVGFALLETGFTRAKNAVNT